MSNKVSHLFPLLYKRLSLILAIIGIGLVLVSLAGNLIREGGQNGFGAMQAFLLFTGVLILLIGVILKLPLGQKLLDGIVTFVKTKEPAIKPSNLKAVFQTSLLTAIWFGLITGFMESFALLFRKHVMGVIIHKSQHQVWMTPLTYLILFIAFGLAVFILSILWKRLASIQVYTFIYTLIGLMGLYYAWKRISFYAAILLSAGIAIQLSIFLGARSASFYRFVKASTPWMLLFLGVIMVAMLGFYA